MDRPIQCGDHIALHHNPNVIVRTGMFARVTLPALCHMLRIPAYRYAP
jgi:hypothetical protein